MDAKRKTAVGAALDTIAGTGIALSLIFGWASVDRPWGFLLGFLLGLASGLGTTFVIAGLLEMRKGRS